MTSTKARMGSSVPHLETFETRLGAMRGFSTIVLALLLVTALSGCFGGGEAAISEPAVPGIVLQPEDLGAGFSRFDEGPLASADTPPGERGDAERFGRRGGWKSRYRRLGSPTAAGPLVVESRVDLFGGAGGAGQEFDAHADELEVQVTRVVAERLVELEDVGDEAVAAVPGASESGSAVFFTVVWRYENVVASVVANGVSGKLGLRDVLALVRDQQRRVERAATRG